FKTLYSGENGFVGHEMILDFRAIKPDYGVDVTDVSKRLMDFGYHAPTLSFPVHDTLMIEPTESENKAELDKFIATIKCIKQEILAYQKDEDSALKNAPHTEAMVTSDEWPYTYGRQHAAFPLAFIKRSKFWPSVSRVDDGYGDRNLICTCNPIEDYMN
ncbi:MAG: glycine dehydrogenase (aminomethyl-transferring), partial [Flavobacteriales bacterium CG03_land_8_20_14_0_80_35_15]